jgi:hypothetical protein
VPPLGSMPCWRSRSRRRSSSVQSLVFRDEGLAADAGRQLLLQPCLVGKQEAFPVAQRRGAIEIPGVEGGLLCCRTWVSCSAAWTRSSASWVCGSVCPHSPPSRSSTRSRAGAWPAPSLTSAWMATPFVLAQQAEQEVSGADLVVPEGQRFPQRQLQHLLGLWRERDVAGGGARALADDLFDLERPPARPAGCRSAAAGRARARAAGRRPRWPGHRARCRAGPAPGRARRPWCRAGRAPGRCQGRACGWR